MRFDDRLETVLNPASHNETGSVTRWHQLIDILAQNPRDFDQQKIAKGLTAISALISSTKKEDRIASIEGTAGRIRSAPLVQLLASDEPDVVAAVIRNADLSDDEWAELIPSLPTRARGFLRNRNDLGPRGRKALQVWSSADFVLPDNAAAKSVAAMDKVKTKSPQKIGAIVEKIEKLRKEREHHISPATGQDNARSLKAKPATEIRFETDDLGTITWVEGVPSASVVGVTLAEPTFDDGPGTDAYGASAFRQKMPIENARLRLAGSSLIEGDWRVNAVPFFNQESGRFRGYRGMLRRPNISEAPEISPAESATPEQVQQLVHELRTPLGAIIGFAEIIEQQLFGPVSHDYRILAHSILNDAHRLLAGFDDLSVVSKLDSDQLAIDDGTTDCSWLTQKLSERLTPLSESLNVTINLSMAETVRPLAVENSIAERIFSRLLSAIIIGCTAGEEFSGRFMTDLGRSPVNHFTLSLPNRLKAMDENALFGSEPNMIDEEEQAPLLGLGFSLRLVRSLARKLGGDLRFENERLILVLPAARHGDAKFEKR